MARRCPLSGKGVLVGNNVSHANNKSKRRYLPNLQYRHLYSETLKETIRLRISVNALRTIDKHGGLDGFLLDTPERQLPRELVSLRRRLLAKREAAAQS
ncbi:50S ribosomal protein L28 [bacterium HR40]|nr:50S ribosomal protein L28 [bacterium HR40]